MLILGSSNEETSGKDLYGGAGKIASNTDVGSTDDVRTSRKGF